MASPDKINWTIIKGAYIGENELSLRGVAKKYGVSYGQVQRVSKKEGWVNEKNERWKEASEDALDKIQDSMSELIVRHAKVGRFLQQVGLSNIKKKYDKLLLVEKSGKSIRGLRAFEDNILVSLVKVGATIERAAFPEKLDITGDVRFSPKGLSKAVDKALYAVFRQNITKRKPTRKRGRGKG